ncbi:TraM recognition domain-containing protein [Sanguibacter hominis ATCC BAA-789]|uniref:TraM recognition domain-containing protein n=1 Tax=Sanguibacter hominis ATCC BAA-789 TaxID=1312740 RepID=A0A9X5IQK2_9MICO|nr:TraM recognition domain-containing protein [Sanguibacter hominis]NKX94262.1 TraM recognition domain-containing protein [Sanguibacter hominis ATCC BAA-789]
MTRNERVLVLLVLTSILLAFYGVAGTVAVRVTCGDWPQGGRGPLGGVMFLLTRDVETSIGTVDGCAPATSTVAVALVCVTVAMLAAVGVIVYKIHAYRLTPAYLRKQILSRREIAGRAEVRREMGPATAVRRGRQVRPTLDNPKTVDIAWQLGLSTGVEVWVSMEDAVLLLGPPRSGKGFTVLTSVIVEAPGAVVTTSSRGDNMEATIAARARKGPVYLFDPEKVTGRATSIRWSPVRGCEVGETAKKRAGVLVAGTGLGSGQNQEWAGKAADVLQCLLHAAAVGGVSLAELHTWTKSPTAARRALAILDTKSNLGWGPMLRTVLDMEQKARDNQWFGVQSALSALDVPDVRRVFEVGPGEAMFDPEAFLAQAGTLYLTAELRQSISAPGGVGVFFSMLLDDIAAAAHRVAMRSPGGRLDPPCTFVLDEIANIHPWQGLPQAMAAGSGEGLQVVAVFQSRNQAREGWGTNGEGTIWESATRKLILGGAADASDLRNLSDLLGMREEVAMSQSWSASTDVNHSEQLRERPVLSLDELRRLPERNVLLVAGRARPMLVDLIPWPERPWAKEVHESKAWHKKHPASDGTTSTLGLTYGARPTTPEES